MTLNPGASGHGAIVSAAPPVLWRASSTTAPGSALREVGRGDEAVVSTADHDRVEALRHARTIEPPPGDRLNAVQPGVPGRTGKTPGRQAPMFSSDATAAASAASSPSAEAKRRGSGPASAGSVTGASRRSRRIGTSVSAAANANAPPIR